MYTELIHENNYTRQTDGLIRQYPRLREVVDCAEWEIGADYHKFISVHSEGPIRLYVWRGDDSDITDIPTIEVAYYYSNDDGCVHLLGARIVPEDES